MIEIEHKFKLNDEQLQRLLQGSTPCGESRYTDTYYDTSEYYHLVRYTYLRKRAEKFELKIRREAGVCAEVYDRDKILEHLELEPPAEKPHLSFEDILEWHDICPRGSFETFRRRYRKGTFAICVDECDFGLRVVEVEKMVSLPPEVADAHSRMKEFIRESELGEFELSRNGFDHKFWLFIAATNPELYKELV